MSNSKKTLSHIIQFTCVAWLLATSCCPDFAQAEGEGRPPKNLILFIGDGMGLAHVTAAWVVKNKLNLEKFPDTALILTHASGKLINSSPGATTAIAAGVLTLPSYIGLDESGSPVKTVMDYAREAKKATGIVVTSAVTDVTPACFVSHLRDRKHEYQVAQDIVDKEIDVVIGGGLKHFLPSSDSRSARPDAQDLIQQLSKTHTVVTSQDDFMKVERPHKLVALLSLSHLPATKDRNLSLAEMVRKAIEILSEYENGFFLLVEGSRIDWAAHRNDGEQMVNEVVDMDDAVGVAYDFAHDRGDTLVVVTADHESGAYAILDGSIDKKIIRKAVFLATQHSAVMVPLFAYGPGSEHFRGIRDQAFVGQLLIHHVQEDPYIVQKTPQP